MKWWYSKIRCTVGKESIDRKKLEDQEVQDCSKKIAVEINNRLIK